MFAPTTRVDLAHDSLPPVLRPGALSVLDITEWFGDTSGGIRTYLLEKGQYVERNDALRQVLVVPGAHDAIESMSGVRHYRLKGPRIPRTPPYRFMLSRRKVARITAHEHPDIIEVGSPFLVGWMVGSLDKFQHIPRVLYYHSHVPRQVAPATGSISWMRQRMYRASWWYTRQLDRLFDVTIVAAKFLADELAAEGVTRVSHVPLGVDLERFHPSRQDARDVTRQQFGIPLDVQVAAFSGRFAGEKNLLTVLDAWPRVERATGARLLLVGAGPQERTLREHPYAPHVIFIPYVTNRDTLANLLAALDMYVAPSITETFGLAACEALASGTPVLAANYGGVAEQVQVSGAGKVFQHDSPDDCVDAAIALLNEDRALHGERGRSYAEQHHAWNVVFERLFAVYRDVIAARSGAR